MLKIIDATRHVKDPSSNTMNKLYEYLGTIQPPITRLFIDEKKFLDINNEYIKGVEIISFINLVELMIKYNPKDDVIIIFDRGCLSLDFGKYIGNQFYIITI